MAIYHSLEDRAAYRELRRKQAEERIEKLATSWKENPEQLSEYFRFAGRFHQYSDRNTMLIYAQNPTATFVAPFEKFAEMGYYVRKGEHGMSIVAPAPVTYFRKTPSHPWRRLSDATDDEKAQVRIGMLESRETMYYTVGTVFDITQTTCPIADYPKLLGLGYADEQHAEIYRVLRDYSGSIGMAVCEDNLGPATRGYYTHADHGITINNMLGDTQKLSTLLHEMSHGIMEHEIYRGLSASQREFEADALSVMFEDRFGIPITDARQKHLAAHFEQYMADLEDAGDKFLPEKAFRRIHENYEKHVESMQAYLVANGIEPIVSPVQMSAEPPIEESAGLPPSELTPEESATEVLMVAPQESSERVGASLNPDRVGQEQFDAMMAEGRRQFDDISFLSVKLPAELQGEFSHCTFYDCDFEGSTVSASFKSCEILNAKTTDAVFRDSSFKRCKIGNTAFRDTAFERISFKNTDFQKCNATRTRFTDISFAGGHVDRFHLYSAVTAERVAGVRSVEVSVSGASEEVSVRHRKKFYAVMDKPPAPQHDLDKLIGMRSMAHISSDDYSRAIHWMAQANREHLVEGVPTEFRGDPTRENTYRLVEYITRANSPQLSPEQLQGEAKGAAYIVLRRMGVAIERPELNFEHLPQTAQVKRFGQVGKCANYLQQRVMNTLGRNIGYTTPPAGGIEQDGQQPTLPQSHGKQPSAAKPAYSPTPTPSIEPGD